MLKRNFVFTLCKGQLQWWYDLHGHWFEGRARLKAVKQCVAIANAALARDRSPVATVAVVMDEQVATFLTLDRQIQRALCWENFYYSFDRLGAPVDLLLLSDLAHADMSRYRAIFFPTTFALTQADRDRIEALKSNHRTLVFYQAAGFIDRDRQDAFRDDGPSALVGIKIAVTNSIFQMRVTTRTGNPLLQDIEDTPFGVHTEKMINFYVDDPSAEPLGHFNGRDAVGLARKVFPDWTSIYSGAPVLPALLVQNIIRAANVHIYGANREDILYANASYVGVFTKESGKKIIHLPRPARVRECFSGRVLAAEPVPTFAWRAQAYQTYLFELS